MKKASEVEKNQLIILKDFFQKDDILFFYSDKKALARTFASILEPMARSSDLRALYIYPREMDKLKQMEFFKNNKNIFNFPILDRKYKKLFEDDLESLEKTLSDFLKNLETDSKVKIIIDLENTVSNENLDQIIGLKSRLEKKFKDCIVNQIYAVDANSVDNEIFGRIIELGDKFIISSNNDYLILSSFHSTGKVGFPKLEFLPRKDMEDRVKKSIDFIVYSILQNFSLCGFDIIKNIFHNFNVFLSQGTVYPILYDLTEKGYLEVQVQSDNKTRVYSVTEEGKNYFKSKIQNYVDSQERVTEFIRSQMEARENE
jgi:DNA-binding PadR family transcriptional regulator